jgi:nitrous oxide reductase accessory protein NosL
MKRVSLMLALAMLALLAAAPAVQAAPSSVFSGEWKATDGDGSKMHLTVGPGPNPQILYIDEHATGGICAGQDTDHFTGLVKGSVDGDTLSATFVVVKCGYVTVWLRPHARDYVVTWTLVDEDTLFDGVVTWTRA